MASGFRCAAFGVFRNQWFVIFLFSNFFTSFEKRIYCFCYKYGFFYCNSYRRICNCIHYFIKRLPICVCLRCEGSAFFFLGIAHKNPPSFAFYNLCYYPVLALIVTSNY